MTDQRQKIISSVFSKRNASGTLEETYVSHVKIWEDAGPEGGGRKPRYILLSQSNNGGGFIHKSKMNTNGTFSVGKTWKLQELRAIQVVNPLAFNITLSRTYGWQTEEPLDQRAFLNALIRLFRVITRGAVPLQLEGIQEPDVASTTSDDVTSSYPSSSTSGTQQPSQNGGNHEQSIRAPSPAVPSQLRGGTISRVSSPDSTRDSATRATDSIYSRTRASSINAPSINASAYPEALRPRQAGARSRIDSGSTTTETVLNGSQANTAQKMAISGGVSQVSPNKLRKRSRDSKTPVRNEAPRRDHNIRVSYFDPGNQTMLDSLTGGTHNDVDAEEGDTQATLANVEEMIEGYEWASEDVIGRKGTRGAADLIEARLLNELTALEKANVHSFLESDDRINIVLKYMDDAVTQLDSLDSLISSYKIHLNALSEDISYIQSQNRGLQVQTQNQRVLLGEIQNLLRTVHVDQEALLILNQESLEKNQSIPRLEEAATELYKALQAGRDTDMAATMARLQEYQTHNAQFCKRIFDFLSIMFTAQSKLLLGETNGLNKPKKDRPTIIPHNDVEAYLGRYSGLMLYLKEMDENIYGKLCASYFSATSELHNTQTKALLIAYSDLVKKVEDEHEQGFSAHTTVTTSKSAATMRRAGTLIRSPMEGRQKDKDRTDVGIRASQVFGLILEQIAPLIYRENDFITDFLQINDAALTFADYMGLDSYFRRQAIRSMNLSQTTMKLVRGAMDLIFGFLPAELKTWLDGILSRDSMEIIGVLATVERFQVEAEERGNQFLINLLSKQHARLKGIFDRHVNTQLKDIEDTKITSKKREGVAPFIKHFPVYIGRVENQLLGAGGLEIRSSVDAAYEKIVETMFDSLKQMAKLEGEGEDKGQLNYHVILIENMHYFVAEMSKLDISSVTMFSKRAEAIYDENLGAYVKIVFRRPFGKIIDYFEGIAGLMKTTSASEIPNQASYNKAALKKIIKEFSAKDIRKLVDALYKRVEKHFTEASDKTLTEDSGNIAPGTVLVGVWKACEDELVRLTQLFSKRISQCYGESGVQLEFGASDVESAFRRQRITS